jgi:hypothetical protein
MQDHSVISKKWQIEIDSPQEFFEAVREAFTDQGIGITRKKDLSFNNSLPGRDRRFEGQIESRMATYRKRRMPLLLGSIIIAFFSGWVMLHFGSIVWSDLRPGKTVPLLDVLVFAGGIGLLALSLGFLKISLPEGRIDVVVRLEGTAHMSKKESEDPDVAVRSEHGGMYSHVTLELALSSSDKAPEELLARANKSIKYLEAKFDELVSREMIPQPDAQR